MGIAEQLMHRDLPTLTKSFPKPRECKRMKEKVAVDEKDKIIFKKSFKEFRSRLSELGI